MDYLNNHFYIHKKYNLKICRYKIKKLG